MKIRFDKKNCILWEAATKKIILWVEDEDYNPQAVTECWRPGIVGMESDSKAEILNKISDDGLIKPDKGD